MITQHSFTFIFDGIPIISVLPPGLVQLKSLSVSYYPISRPNIHGLNVLTNNTISTLFQLFGHLAFHLVKKQIFDFMLLVSSSFVIQQM